MTDRDQQLTHAQRRISNHERYDGGPGVDLQSGQVALQVACHDPPACDGTVAEHDGRPIAPDEVRICDENTPSFRLFAAPLVAGAGRRSLRPDLLGSLTKLVHPRGDRL